jgi:hypothetical protein
MSQRTNPASGAGPLPGWFRYACFALIVLLLHNPFLIAPARADGLNVSHLPSYRATIAASELQHFTPASAQNDFTAKAALSWNNLGLLQADWRHPRITFSQVVSHSQQFWCASLWFRPPPPF